MAARPAKGKRVGGPARAARRARSQEPRAVLAGVPRVGHGYDIHKLQPGGKTVMAGVVVSEQMSPVAHSDGDVVIHAVVDALLGAMGWGDIGEMFSDKDDGWKAAASRGFVEIVYPKVRSAGYRLSNLDVTILAERPRIAPFKPRMIATLHELFGPDATINIKAGTNEGCDAVGRGEAIAAHAVVMLTKN